MIDINCIQIATIVQDGRLCRYIPGNFAAKNPSTDFTFSTQGMVSDQANIEASQPSWPSLSFEGKGFACSGAFFAVLAAKTPSETALSAQKTACWGCFQAVLSL